jgi:hypothetical protein
MKSQDWDSLLAEMEKLALLFPQAWLTPDRAAARARLYYEALFHVEHSDMLNAMAAVRKEWRPRYGEDFPTPATILDFVSRVKRDRPAPTHAPVYAPAEPRDVRALVRILGEKLGWKNIAGSDGLVK